MATSVSPLPEELATAGVVCGRGASVRSLHALVADLARTDIPVLLIGESGTGKEVYARLIHRLSGSGETVLKKVSCTALDAPGLLRQVQEGLQPGRGEARTRTLFLDGVDELDPACQRVLLSLLPDGDPKSGAETMARLISSASINLEKEVETGRFRRELYFRINGAILRLPPLRDRKEDIPALLEYFLTKHAGELKSKTLVLDSVALELLTSYDWPGNIRELENMAKKILALGDAKVALDDLRAAPVNVPKSSHNGGVSSLKIAAREASRRTEREMILKALEGTHWNRKRAARELQISYKALLYKIKQIGVQESESEAMRRKIQ